MLGELQAFRRPRFAGFKSKWQRRRVARQFARTAQGKKPLVEPLTIAPLQERKTAFAEGNIVFYNGEERITLAAKGNGRDNCNLWLQGAFKASDGKLFSLRGHDSYATIMLFEIKKDGNRFSETPLICFFSTIEDLAHMEIENQLRGQGIGLKGASKAERHVRAKKNGRHFFRIPRLMSVNFVGIFERLGYNAFPITEATTFLWKKGKHQPLDDMRKFHRIEAIDPRNGKVRIFTFPLKE